MMSRLFCGDAIETMRSLRAGSVDAVIVDPPFGTTDLKWDKAPPLDDWWREVDRVSKPEAVIAAFASGKFVPELIASNRRNWRYDLIWAKNRPVGFLDCNLRPLRSHENILVFCRRFKASTYNPQKTPGRPYRSVRREHGCAHYHNHRAWRTINRGDRHPVSVLRFDACAGGENLGHPTQKPLGLIEWLVASFSNPGDVVLDSYMGSGTTGVACRRLDRRFVGIEISKKYFNLARRRIGEVDRSSPAAAMAAAA